MQTEIDVQANPLFLYINELLVVINAHMSMEIIDRLLKRETIIIHLNG